MNKILTKFFCEKPSDVPESVSDGVRFGSVDILSGEECASNGSPLISIRNTAYSGSRTKVAVSVGNSSCYLDESEVDILIEMLRKALSLSKQSEEAVNNVLVKVSQRQKDG